MNDHVSEASKLISQHIDGVMTDGEESRLAQLMSEDSRVVDLYIRIMKLHGELTWGDADCSSDDAVDNADVESPVAGSADARLSSHGLKLTDQSQQVARRRQNQRVKWLVSTTAVLAAVTVLGLSWLNQTSNHPTSVASTEALQLPEPVDVAQSFTHPPVQIAELPPLQFDIRRPSQSTKLPAESLAETGPLQARTTRFTSDITDSQVVTAINRRITATLEENGVQPSPKAGSEEWTRRAWLTVVGRIPSVDESRASLGHTESGPRHELIEQLLQSSERSRRLAEVWTSLLVGRSERRQIDRPALRDYLYSAFRENRPWITMVSELISAVGRSDENGATNFLLAHLDNQATPATAVTARLFLGSQLQCVQCHNHPFDTQIKQHEYWAFNAFFQHTDSEVVDVSDSSQPLSTGPLRLTDRPAAGMTYFETRHGHQKAVVASYDGRRIPADSKVRRRAVLAEYLATDSQSRVALAMVNRVWADFFGYGFSNPVDEMGLHVTISHPELLATLADAFVASGYDLQRLQKWIALSDAWQCTSQATQWNKVDAPETGETPLFSRVYMRRMAPEQVYDSIRVAVRMIADRPVVLDTDSGHRRQWVSQFVRPYNTDENDEADEFIGSITQAMVMMNGPDINSAIRHASETILTNHIRSASVDSVLQHVSLAVLTRRPTVGESRIFRQHLRRLSRADSYQNALPRVIEDMLWAYLNSSEFQLIH